MLFAHEKNTRKYSAYFFGLFSSLTCHRWLEFAEEAENGRSTVFLKKVNLSLKKSSKRMIVGKEAQYGYCFADFGKRYHPWWNDLEHSRFLDAKTNIIR